VLKLNIFRAIAIFLTQVLLILIVGAKFDLIFGFNRIDSGFTLLLYLFLLVPLLNLSWIVIEIIRSVRLSKDRSKAKTFLVPLIPVFFFLESIATDLFIASHMRM
jgi:hypothetical protein